MTAIVATETLLLAVLTLFVVALLRSHAEILRRLENVDPAHAVPRPESATGSRRAPDLAGATPSGGARQVAASGNLLLAFLLAAARRVGGSSIRYRKDSRSSRARPDW